jgi:carnitine 3-dehydrogenase
MITIDEVHRVGIIGGGTIGASWAAFFLSRGLTVSIYDPVAERRWYVEDFIQKAWPTLEVLHGRKLHPPDQWTFYDNLPNAVAEVQFVQESVPETAEIKRAVFRELDQLVQPEAVIASSTSTLRLTDLQVGLNTAQRFVVAHPFNPPHLVPLIEIVGGEHTGSTTRAWCRDFYERNGKTVLMLHKEVIGHVVNRLQAALFQEAVWLIREAVAEVADVDRAIAWGPALRWVLMGPFLTFHLGAQDQGIRGYLHNLGDAHLEMWKGLGKVEELSPGLVDTIAAGIDRETAGAPVETLLLQRDRALVALMMQLESEIGRLVP